MTKQFAALKSFNKSVTLPIFLFLMAWGMAFCTYCQNVGIGTTNPPHKFTVNSDYAGGGGNANWIAADFGNSAPNGLRLVLGINSNVPTIMGINGEYNVGSHLALNPFDIIGGSNVGVGTLTPMSKLHVVGSTGLTVNLNSTGMINNMWAVNLGNVSAGNRLLMGVLSGVATIGAYSSNLTTPATLVINPAGGNVGIGTTSPGAKLDVNGNIKASALQLTTGAAAGRLLQSDANGNASWVSAATITTAETDPKIGTLNSNRVPKWNGTTLADGLLFDNGTNIGIGTTTPAQKLDVIGTTRTTTFQMTNGSASGFYLRSDAEGNATWAALPSTSPSGAAGGDLAGTYPNPTLALTGIAAGTYTKLQVDAKGRAIVGSNLSAADITPLETDPQIGTNTTNYLSKWNGTALVGSSVSESNGYMGIGLPANVFANAPLQVNSLYSGSGSTNWISASMGGANNANRVVMGMLNGDATIGGHSGTLSAWTDLIINPATVGNVGIGTDQPTAKLDVSGSVRLGNQGSVMDYIRSIEVIVSTVDLGPNVAVAWNIDNFPLNLSPNAAVMANPKENLPLGIVIGWVRRTGTNTIRVQYQNTTNLSIFMASHRLQVTAINFQ
jgi:hypothetical protein